MARKKIIKEGYHLKFIPKGRLDDLIEIANNFPEVQDKQLALWKVIEVFSSIVERCQQNDKKFIPVNYRVLRNKLGLKKGLNKLLKALIDKQFLDIDKSTKKINVSSYSYKPIYDILDVIKIPRRFLNKKTDYILEGNRRFEIDPDLKLYESVINKITFDQSIHEYINNKYNSKLFSDSNSICNGILSSAPSTSLTNGYNLYNNNNKRYSNSTIDKSTFVPESKYTRTLLYPEIVGSIPTELIPVYKIIAGKFRVSRPNPKSRVYTNLTNLEKEWRPFLRLPANAEPLIGFDIVNSQPLIATILFRGFSEKAYGYIKDDVLDYQQQCESGKFYEYFMELNNIDITSDDARGKLKEEFYKKVFYNMELPEENYFQIQFKNKYPTCYEAIFAIKGGMYSKTHAVFPVDMSIIETDIIFNTNIELIKMGYDVVNIFDSLYSNSPKAIEIAKKMVMEKFAEFGITPKLKDIDYRTGMGKFQQNSSTTKCPKMAI